MDKFANARTMRICGLCDPSVTMTADGQVIRTGEPVRSSCGGGVQSEMLISLQSSLVKWIGGDGSNSDWLVRARAKTASYAAPYLVLVAAHCAGAQSHPHFLPPTGSPRARDDHRLEGVGALPQHHQRRRAALRGAVVRPGDGPIAELREA